MNIRSRRIKDAQCGRRLEQTVSVPERAAAMVRAAIRVATGPAPGPVHLEIPAEMFGADVGTETPYREENPRYCHLEADSTAFGAMRAVIDVAQCKAAIDRSRQRRRHLEAWDELTRFAEALRCRW